jgi:hypothetical protein
MLLPLITLARSIVLEQPTTFKPSIMPVPSTIPSSPTLMVDSLVQQTCVFEHEVIAAGGRAAGSQATAATATIAATIRPDITGTSPLRSIADQLYVDLSANADECSGEFGSDDAWQSCSSSGREFCAWADYWSVKEENELMKSCRSLMRSAAFCLKEIGERPLWRRVNV